MKDISLFRIGTRGSLLARTQSEWVLEKLTEKCPEQRFEIITIRTTGDKHTGEILPRSLGKGHFTREIEEALLSGEVDLAVHSLKDLPTELPDGLQLGAIPEREDPRDALIGNTVGDLRGGVDEITVGTSSLRRIAQLKAMIPECRVVNLRGNLDTRLRKVKQGEVDCAVIAAAGLCRLKRDDEISEFFDTADMLPAPGQGALGIEIRKDDDRVADIVKRLHCSITDRCVTAERAFLHRLGGGCQVPVAALAAIGNGSLNLRGRVISMDGVRCFDGSRSGPPENAADLGQELADDLLEQGAGDIIEEIMNDL